MSKQPNYTEAYQELQTIIQDIEDGQIGVDELSEKVKRATLLIKICKQKLSATEEDVNKILKELEWWRKLNWKRMPALGIEAIAHSKRSGEDYKRIARPLKW